MRQFRQLVAVLGLGLILSSGCRVAPEPSPNSPRAALDSSESFDLAEPVFFANYAALYRYIAANENLPQDDKTLLHLAANSSFEPATFSDAASYCFVIQANFYVIGNDADAYHGLRGASNNGNYYLVHPVASGAGNLTRLELIGIGTGCSYTWGVSENGQREFITYWHLSATEGLQQTYQWNGRIFRAVSPAKRISPDPATDGTQ